MKNRTVFLKVQQKGDKITLYSFTDNVKTRYFVTDHAAGKTYELIYRLYYIPELGVATHVDNEYVSQLYSLASKYNPSSEDLKSKIEKANYNTTELRKISQMINNMAEDKTQYETQSSFDFFAGAGISASNFTFGGPNPPIHNLEGNKTVFGPTISAGVNFYTNAKIGRAVFRAELMYWSVINNLKGDIYYNQLDKPKIGYRLSQRNISIYPQFLYYFYNTNAVKFYGGVGVMLSFPSYKQTITSGGGSGSSNNLIALDKNWFALPIRAGVILNRTIELNASYAIPGAISSQSGVEGYSVKQSGFKAGVNYHFQ